jgi:hypothetical protein
MENTTRRELQSKKLHQTNKNNTTSSQQSKNKKPRPKKKSVYSPPPASLKTNRNGLPFNTQKALLANVSRFRGLDDFAKDTCDKNPDLFGLRNSKKRKACQDKRRHFLDIYRTNPSKFLELCAEFDTVAEDIIQPPSSATAYRKQSE